MEARRSCSFQHYKQRLNEALESLKIDLGTLLRSSTMRNSGKIAFFSHYQERNTAGRAIYHVITRNGPLLISTRSKVLVRNQSSLAYLLWIKCMKCFIAATLASECYLREPKWLRRWLKNDTRKRCNVDCLLSVSRFFSQPQCNKSDFFYICSKLLIILKIHYNYDIIFNLCFLLFFETN